MSVLMNALLPGPTGPGGDEIKTGCESQSSSIPRMLTGLSDTAIGANNEANGRTRVAEPAETRAG